MNFIIMGFKMYIFSCLYLLAFIFNDISKEDMKEQYYHIIYDNVPFKEAINIYLTNEY